MRNFIYIIYALAFLVCGCEGRAAAPVTILPPDTPDKPDEKPEGKTYCNPVLHPDTFGDTKIGTMADPGILKDDDGTYYLVVTGRGINTFKSKDLVNWEYCGKIFTGDGIRWAKKKGDFWAPEMIKHNGRYYLHYSADDVNGIKRIGLAVSDSPTGPFTDVDDKPFFSHAPEKGSIDSHIFKDTDGKMYFYYSNAMSTNVVDGIKRSEVWGAPLKDDLSGLESDPVMLIYPQQDWEHLPGRTSFWNEGNTIVRHGDKYYMLYSANSYATERYAVGYAVADSPLGPYVKYSGNPIMKAVPGKVSGPGHQCVIESPDGKELFCVYHSHYNLDQPGGVRMINIDRLGFYLDGIMYIDGPTYDGQPYPSGADKDELFL